VRKAGKQDLILVGGSTFVVADFLKKKLEEERDFAFQESIKK
jgi:hypothetical protein